MTITVNLDGVEAWNAGQILPPGKHVVRIEDASEGTSSGGHPQLEVEFAAVDGTGSIRDWLVVTQGAMGKIRAFLEAAGIQIPEGPFQVAASALRGARLQIVVAEEPDYRDPDKKRSRVMGYLSAPGAVAGNGRAVEVQQQPSGGFSPDDDIPF